MSQDEQRRIVIRNLPYDTTEIEFIQYLRSRKSCQQYFESDPPLAVLTSFKSGKAANPLKERGDVHATAFVVVKSVQVAQNIAAALDSIAYRPDVHPNLLIAVEYSPYQDAATFEDLPSSAANPAAGSILMDDEYLTFVRDVVEKSSGSKAVASVVPSDAAPGETPGLTRASALEIWLAEQKTKDETKLNTALVSALLGKWYHKKPFGWERRKAERDAKDRCGKDAVIEEEERVRKEKELRRKEKEQKKEKKREERREEKRKQREAKRTRKEAARKDKSEKNGTEERRPRRRKGNSDAKGGVDGGGKDVAPGTAAAATPGQPLPSNQSNAPKHSKAELREDKKEKQHRRDRQKDKKPPAVRPELRTKEDEILDKQRLKDEKKQRMKDKAEKERRMKATIEEANTRKESSHNNNNDKGEGGGGGGNAKRNTFSVSTTKKLSSSNGRGQPAHADAVNFPTLGHRDDERPPAAAAGVWRGKQGDSSTPPPSSSPPAAAPAPKRVVLMRRDAPRPADAPPSPPTAL